MGALRCLRQACKKGIHLAQDIGLVGAKYIVIGIGQTNDACSWISCFECVCLCACSGEIGRDMFLKVGVAHSRRLRHGVWNGEECENWNFDSGVELLVSDDCS